MRDLQGIDLSTTARHDVHFTINRDAGKIDAEGFVHDGDGAGFFHFIANTKYIADMAALGFSGIEDDQLIQFAIHDVSLNFAREMKGAGVNGLDKDKLIAFRIFNVNKSFIDEMRAAGIPETDADKLIAFRIHGVTPGDGSRTKGAGILAGCRQADCHAHPRCHARVDETHE